MTNELPEVSFQKIELEKPAVLYHASSNKDITEFEPRAETVRDPNEGPVVFATPDKAGATRFLVPTNDSWTQISTYDGVRTIIISDRERFEAMDAGGAIYAIPSDTFHCDASKSATEWTSRVPVRPTGKTEYESAFKAMLDAGVQVYFVDGPTFDAIQNSDDHGYSILKGLQSENEQLGWNHIAFPDR